MRLDVRDSKDPTLLHASADYLWEESVISVDGQTVDHVVALDTIEGWVLAYDQSDLANWKQTLWQGVVEYFRLDASEQ